MTDVTCAVGTAYPSGASEFTPLCLMMFMFLNLYFPVQYFVYHCLSIRPAPFQFTVSEWPFGISKPFSPKSTKRAINCHLKQFNVK